MKKVIALLPAHNEEVQIRGALDALLAQTRAPDKILVVLDNCMDSTEQIVQRYAPTVEYMTTVDNPHKKAGALNQVMAECTDYEYVLDTDADAILDVNFCERAIAEMDADNKIGALSVREGVRDYRDMTWKRRFIYRVVRFQRYQWDTFRMENPQDCMVVVGPGSMIRTEALLDVGGWDNDSLTEDNALSLDLREHGWRTVLGTKCFAWSDTPLHFGELWQQRVRWSRGSEDYAKRSWSKATYKGKLLAKYNWLLLFWMLLVIPYDAILGMHGMLQWWFFAPLAVLYLDRLWRLRFYPQFKALDVIFAFTLSEIAMFTCWQATSVHGAYQRLFKIDRHW